MARSSTSSEKQRVSKPACPREILSEQGSDLAKGIRQFCAAHPETCSVSDVKHKVATVLKRELGAARAWQEFSTPATQTIARVQQTALAALAPPRQRRKARYMNVGELVAWGRRMVRSWMRRVASGRDGTSNE